jgi:hypothetical protein
LAVVTEKLTALKSPKLVETVAAYARDSQPAAPAPSSTAGPTDLLVGMLTWVKDHWLVLATAGLAILFLMSRLAKG